MAEVVHHHARPDGSEVRITATEMFGLGLHRSVDVYAHRRESPEHPWMLLGDRPAPGYREMSVDEYIAHGRPPLFHHTTFGERVRAVQALQSIAAHPKEQTP